jgi:hypothetical protein
MSGGLQQCMYVAKNGSDTYTGSSIQPYATIQYALEKIPANNTTPYTIYLAPGVYEETLLITKTMVSLVGLSDDIAQSCGIRIVGNICINLIATDPQKDIIVLTNITLTAPEIPIDPTTAAYTLRSVGQNYTLCLKNAMITSYNKSTVVNLEHIDNSCRVILNHCVIQAMGDGDCIDFKNGDVIAIDSCEFMAKGTGNILNIIGEHMPSLSAVNSHFITVGGGTPLNMKVTNDKNAHLFHGCTIVSVSKPSDGCLMRYTAGCDVQLIQNTFHLMGSIETPLILLGDKSNINFFNNIITAQTANGVFMPFCPEPDAKDIRIVYGGNIFTNSTNNPEVSLTSKGITYLQANTHF